MGLMNCSVIYGLFLLSQSLWLINCSLETRLLSHSTLFNDLFSHHVFLLHLYPRYALSLMHPPRVILTVKSHHHLPADPALVQPKIGERCLQHRRLRRNWLSFWHIWLLLRPRARRGGRLNCSRYVWHYLRFFYQLFQQRLAVFSFGHRIDSTLLVAGLDDFMDAIPRQYVLCAA